MKSPKNRLLPPGCAKPNAGVEPGHGNKAIYVGSVSEVDGTYKMLDAMKTINKQQQRISLKLICRKKDWEMMGESYQELSQTGWLEVVHADGDEELKKHYQTAGFAIFPRENDFYNNLAMPVKITEYISYLKPIVSTNCTSISRFILDNQVGIITDYTVEGIVAGILEMAENEAQRKQFVQNCMMAREKNSWKARAEQAVNDLTAYRKELS